jgi:hypothetical protein
MLAGEVVTPVGVEVAVVEQGAELEDGVGSSQPPAGTGDVEAVGRWRQIPFDHFGRGRPARREGAVVARERRVGGQAADSRVRAAALIVGQGSFP